MNNKISGPTTREFFRWRNLKQSSYNKRPSIRAARALDGKKKLFHLAALLLTKNFRIAVKRTSL
jgi:hypothetical protein